MCRLPRRRRESRYVSGSWCWGIKQVHKHHAGRKKHEKMFYKNNTRSFRNGNNGRNWSKNENPSKAIANLDSGGGGISRTCSSQLARAAPPRNVPPRERDGRTRNTEGKVESRDINNPISRMMGVHLFLRVCLLSPVRLNRDDYKTERPRPRHKNEHVRVHLRYFASINS